MNWTDIFDFESTRPTTPTPPPYSALSSTFERDFCSNFSCCGLSLADLHELLAHFEEHHVLVLGRDGQPVCPSDAQDDAGACSSVVLSYPQPDPPAAPWPSPPLLLDVDVMDRALSDVDADSASLSSGSGSTLPSPNPGEPICLPPSLLSVHAPASTTMAEGQGKQKWAQKKEGNKDRTPRAQMTYTRGKMQVVGQRHAHAKKRAREKAYKCPRTGCSKSYLNPNGLKYHLEKGTCTTTERALGHDA